MTQISQMVESSGTVYRCPDPSRITIAGICGHLRFLLPEPSLSMNVTTQASRKIIRMMTQIQTS